MCGINGILRLDPAAAPVDVEEALRTRERMRTRGPDGAGLWSDPSGDIVLGHRRLSIIDLSDAGLQPMASADGRYQIVFNGEIYNYRELRARLQAQYPFRSQTDTEVILALYASEGVPGLARLRGMFAFGLWDTREKRLLLARDPNGIKPLYYANDGRHFRFASQVKALVAGGAIPTNEDPAGLCGFLLWGAVPEPWTIYESVKALPAGHLLQVDREGAKPPEPLPHRTEEPGESTDLLAAIEDSVKAHLISDVPVAIFLSAGLDSGMVAAIATRHLPEPPVTITLRFREFENTPDDEGPLAAEVARVLGTRHIERWVSKDEFLAAWDATLDAMDQPSIDGFNTYWVCKAAREAGVKVALSGLGGDELLGGYPSFRDVPRWNQWVRIGCRLPGLDSAWPRIARWWRPGTPKLQGLLRYGRTLGGAYFLRRGLFLPDELPSLVNGRIAASGSEVLEALQTLAPRGKGTETEAWLAVQALETKLYLRNQLLRDSDWASMTHSVELRVPLVDTCLHDAAASSAFSLPRRLGKVGVVGALSPSLPREVLSRRKTGFRVPERAWVGSLPRVDLSGGARFLSLRVLEDQGWRARVATN